MKSAKLKVIIGMASFALAIAGAGIAYNSLSQRAAAGNAQSGLSPGNAAAKQKAPDFSMLDIKGNTVKLSEMEGKPVVLNFWASWCPPCKIEMPDFDKVYRELGSEVNFMMVDLADGNQETVEKGSQYIKDNGFSFPVYFDTKQEGAYMYGIRSIPTTLFIDKDGYVITGAQGAIDEDLLRQGIEFIR